jgi:hypothetical protein
MAKNAALLARKLVKIDQLTRVVSVIAWSIRGDVKDIFLPRPEGEEISLPSSPCA